MKKNKLYSISIIALVIISTLFFADLSKDEKLYSPRKSNSLNQINGSSYISKLRANQITNKIDFLDVLNAEKSSLAMLYNSSKDANNTWVELGPDNFAGRIRGLLVDKDNSSLIFAGAVNGGIWKSTNAGSSWSQIAVDVNNTNLRVSTIVQAPNGDIYVGTGETFTNFAGTTGVTPGFTGNGIWKSTDRGTTWTQLTNTIPLHSTNSSDYWAYVNEIAINPSNSDIIYAGTNRGAKVSTDGGANWSDLGTGLTSDVYDIKISADGVILLCERNGIDLRSYKSTDGTTFTLISGDDATDLPYEDISRIEYAYAPSDNNYIYACVADNAGDMKGVYLSTDKGETWSIIAQGAGSSFDILSPQGFYNNVITVHPTNKEKVFVGGIDLWVGDKNGSRYDWRKKSLWYYPYYHELYVHADKHNIAFDPKNPSILYIGSDGGVSKSIDGGEKFINCNNGINITQFYSIDCNKKGWVMGGTQDNGALLIDYSLNTLLFGKEVSGGDGGGVAFSNITSDIYFSTAYFGITYRTYKGNLDYDAVAGVNTFFNIRMREKETIGAGGAASFNTPIHLWEKINNAGPVDTAFFLGLNNKIYMTRGALVMNKELDWWIVASFVGTPQALATSADGDALFVGTQEGKVLRVTNLTAVRDSSTGEYTSTNYKVDTVYEIPLVNFTPSPGTNRFITSIAVDQNDANRVVITYGNYGNDDYVYYSENALDDVATFASIQNNLPEAPVYKAIIDKKSSGRILLATETGVYVSTDTGAIWNSVNTTLGNMPVFDIVQQDSSLYNIYIATHGRGMFKTTGIVGISDIKSSKKSNALNIYPNPVKDNASLNFNSNEVQDAKINIYNISGTLVSSYKPMKLQKGQNKLNINTSNLKNGTYIVSVQTGEQKYSSKMIVIK